jgi:MoaA/NifB/PqqE/SkfB family radical SAM enzyme
LILYNEIKRVHLEISSLCNARCPLCPRNFNGYPYNDGYYERNLSLEDIQKIFVPDFLKQLILIRINGNFGDAVMNPETPDICKYFLTHNPSIQIVISTNGSARAKSFWQQLGQLGIQVTFCLDGLEDTHHLYRQNTSWSQILKNAQTFMKAGGTAVWKMIKFDHNQHQITECKQLSQEMGFSKFQLVDHGRNQGPVYDIHGNLVHVLGSYQGETSFEIRFHKKKTDMVLLEDINIVDKGAVTCQTVKHKEIYISSTGEVSPCCWTGFSPENYGKGAYFEVVNAQLKPLISKNNALEYPLETCIEWFNGVEKSWNIEKFENGRLIACNDNCGSA